MPPSASIRSRIQAFEALSSSSSSTSSSNPTPTLPPSSPNHSAPSSANPLESPISPTASTFHPIIPFSALASSTRSRSRPSSPSTPSLVHRASLIDLKDWIVEDGPVEPSSVPISNLNGIRESSRTPSPPGKPASEIRAASNSSTPLISFELPSKLGPPLPPRKPFLGAGIPHRVLTQHSASPGSEKSALTRPFDSLTIEHTYPPVGHKFGTGRAGHAPASSISSFHSVSLSSEGSNVESPIKTSSEPPSFTFEVDSSIVDFDTASIAESFENVSAPSAHSPSTVISFDWDQPVGKSKSPPPKLEPPSLPNRANTKIPPVVPPKQLARSISTSSSSTATSTKTRRPPPLPPYQPRSRPSSSRASVISTSASTSDRSSILSSTTTTSRTSSSTRNSAQTGGHAKPSSLLRPTPVPPAARSRYESLFDCAVKGRRRAATRKQKSKSLAPPPLAGQKGGQAAGWRTLPVDLMTGPEAALPSEKRADESDSEREEESVGPEEKLNGRIVRHIWSASQLDRQKLGSIWNDCDSQKTGFINRDAFVTGMWRIDEELRRAQLARRTSALTAASSQRIPHRPFLPPRPQGATRLLI